MTTNDHDQLRTQAESVDSYTLARAIADEFDEEEIARLLFPYLLDKQALLTRMNEAAHAAGVDRQYARSAPQQHVARGNLKPAGFLNGGYVFWSWDVEKFLQRLGRKTRAGKAPKQQEEGRKGRGRFKAKYDLPLE